MCVLKFQNKSHVCVMELELQLSHATIVYLWVKVMEKTCLPGAKSLLVTGPRNFAGKLSSCSRHKSARERNWGGDRNSLFWNEQAKQADAYLLSQQVKRLNFSQALCILVLVVFCYIMPLNLQMHIPQGWEPKHVQIRHGVTPPMPRYLHRIR